ncbi:MAG: tyrosine-type recombinase/integrase [Firmicutes bacterium]|nr:tyrosine-type recombinase/integrase [Bacillota bacterium]
MDYNKKLSTMHNKTLGRLMYGLPQFCEEFFIGIESNTTILTRLNYAYDLRIFFNYLVGNSRSFQLDIGESLKLKNPELVSGKSNNKNLTNSTNSSNLTNSSNPTNLTNSTSSEAQQTKEALIENAVRALQISDLEKITITDIERFISSLSSYDTHKQRSNKERGKARKLSTIRSFFKYFFNKGKLSSNLASKVAMPKIKDKEIIRLEVDEVVKILNVAESGDKLTTRQKAFHDKTSLRDSALLSLFLGTGIRISELVGLNVDEVNFEDNSFIVTRKGGARTILYFSDEVAGALITYINQRNEILLDAIKSLENKVTKAHLKQGYIKSECGLSAQLSKLKSEKALFLSLQISRISTRAVQNLVKKYAEVVSPLKRITPHKLRSTYGTTLYRETGDIYLVADVLGHKDVNTTKKHYAAIAEDSRKQAANKVRLRD